MTAFQHIKDSEDMMQKIIEDNEDRFGDFAVHEDAPNFIKAYLNFALVRHYAIRSLDPDD